jgi:hypothetical protein
MEKSDSIVKLSKALVKMQSEMGAASKSSDNPFFKSKYADLNSVWEAVAEPLHNNGLAVTQLVGEYVDGTQSLESVLIHESGEWISCKSSIPLARKDPHGAGSGITYLRRYNLASLTGCLSELDDDANAAADPKKRGKGAIIPTDGAEDECTPGEIVKAKELSAEIRKNYVIGEFELARKLFYDDKSISNECKLLVWTHLQSDSACRRKIKKLQDEKNQNSK